MNTRFFANSDRRTALTRRYTLIYFLLFFCGSLFLFLSSAAGAACTPVVYAFRHAEDFGTNLTEVGLQHAALYESMVASLGPAHNYCPVAYVYSTYDTNPDGGAGTNNPFETGRFLSVGACYNFPYVSSQSLAKCNFFPRMALENGGKLYEYLGAANSEKGTPKAGKSATGSELRNELISRADKGLSTAIFWTSQGLNVLGQAITGRDIVDIPGCSEPPKPGTKCDKDKAPRNAAYVFEFNGENAFDLIVPGNKYVQCFDVRINKFCIPGDPHPTPPELEGPPTVTTTGETTTYWCGNGGVGNLPATSDLTRECDQTLPSTFNNLDSLQGKICATSDLMDKGRYAGYYGYCQ